MICSLLTLHGAADQDDDAIADFYRRHEVLQRARVFPGCRGTQLLRSIDDPTHHVVTAEWESVEDYRRWVEDPWRSSISGQLGTVLSDRGGEPIVGALFQVLPV